MSDLKSMTIGALKAALQEGEASAQEVVEQLLTVVEEDAGRVGAFLSLDKDSVREQASVCDELRGAGKDNKLLGIPISIKDLINVKGDPCTCSSHILEGYVAPYDATV